MQDLTRISFDSKIMGGKPCIRGMRVTVATIVGLIASGHSFDEILRAIRIWKKKICANLCVMRRGASGKSKFRLIAGKFSLKIFILR